MTLGTKAALFKAAGRVRTEAGDGTVTPVGAVIEGTPKTAGFPEKHMVTDFLGNGSTIPSQSPADFLKGSRMVKQGFDGNPFH